jgi:hypothetical protein
MPFVELPPRFASISWRFSPRGFSCAPAFLAHGPVRKSRRVSLIHFSYESPTYERVACSWTAIKRKAPRCGLPIFADPFHDMLSFPSIMMKRETFAVADIYVPVKRRATLVQKRVDEIADSMLEVGQRRVRYLQRNRNRGLQEASANCLKRFQIPHTRAMRRLKNGRMITIRIQSMSCPSSTP